LEREPSARYRSASDLAEDLERWLRGQPIAARPLSPPALVWRWTRRKPVVAGMAALLMALGVIAGAVMWKGAAVTPAPTTGIAILPFETLSDDKEDAIFADGIQDDILTKLASIRDLRVISHTSVMKYRGKRNIPEIGKVLGVSHVLEGTVSRSRGSARFHLKARLIDARTGTLVWAEEYDRDLNNVFAVQSELARKAAERLRAKISSAEQLAVEQPPTTDLVAFDLYNRAKSLLELRLSSGLKANLLQAVDFIIVIAIKRIVTPGWVPVASVEKIIPADDENNSIAVLFPPIAIVPLMAVSSERVGIVAVTIAVSLVPFIFAFRLLRFSRC
jgi:TolB-like protein